ncbi:hypothetical protein D3C81_87330 [compost metagenome]
MINKSINNKINQLNFQGRSDKELKSLYIKRNSLNIEPESFIYRIFRADFLLEDIKNSEITFVRVGPDSFADPLENPLLNKRFTEGNDSFTLGFLENYYASCWTNDPINKKWRWTEFLKGRTGVRIKVSLQKFMNRLMDTRDNHFMLHYFAVKVIYEDDQILDNLIASNDYTAFLDSLGQKGALLASTLSDSLEHEREIRIIYSYMPENQFVANRVKIKNSLCKLPFNWSDLIEEILMPDYLPIETYTTLESKFRGLGICCTIDSGKSEN